MSKKDEEVGKVWAEPYKELPLYLFDDMSGDTTKLEFGVNKLIRAAFLAGCAHKEKQFERLVEISGRCVAAYKAKAEELWACLDQLDEILKEVGDGE